MIKQSVASLVRVMPCQHAEKPTWSDKDQPAVQTACQGLLTCHSYQPRRHGVYPGWDIRLVHYPSTGGKESQITLAE